MAFPVSDSCFPALKGRKRSRFKPATDLFTVLPFVVALGSLIIVTLVLSPYEKNTLVSVFEPKLKMSSVRDPREGDAPRGPSRAHLPRQNPRAFLMGRPASQGVEKPVPSVTWRRHRGRLTSHSPCATGWLLSSQQLLSPSDKGPNRDTVTKRPSAGAQRASSTPEDSDVGNCCVRQADDSPTHPYGYATGCRFGNIEHRPYFPQRI